MAAVTSAVVGAATAAGSLYISAKQASDSKKQAKEAKEALEKYNRQKLENPYADLRVSKLGADLAREEAARNYANSISAIQASGLTGLSILPQLTATQNTMNRQIGADLDRQFVQNENLKAQGRNVVMNMQEQREIADLAGLGQQMYAGQQNYYRGLQNTMKALPGFLNGAMGAYGAIRQSLLYINPNDTIGNKLQPEGLDISQDVAPTGGLLPWNSQSLWNW